MLMSVMNVPSMRTQVGGFDVLAHVLVAAHRAAVDAEVKRMVFRDRALAQKIGRDRDVHPFRHLHDQVRAGDSAPARRRPESPDVSPRE